MADFAQSPLMAAYQRQTQLNDQQSSGNMNRLAQVLSMQQHQAQMEAMQQEQVQKQSQQATLQKFASSLPADQQEAFMLDPKGYLESQRKLKDPRVVTPGGSLVDGTGKSIFTAPREKKAPEGMEYDAAGVLREIPGYVAMRSKIAAAGRAPAGESKAPMGYRYMQDGSLQAIPGGPADLKQQGALNQDTASLGSSVSALDRLAETANVLKNHPGLKGITGLRGSIFNMPGSDAADAEAQLRTLKSQTAFGVLQAMRDASKTGGALGAVSEKELALLENNLAALDKAQSLEQFQSSLDGIVKYTDGAKARLRGAYNLKHGDKAPAQPSGGAKFLGFE